jgi:hypothetical protein
MLLIQFHSFLSARADFLSLSITLFSGGTDGLHCELSSIGNDAGHVGEMTLYSHFIEVRAIHLTHPHFHHSTLQKEP